jgi:hypothetical protein
MAKGTEGTLEPAKDSVADARQEFRILALEIRPRKIGFVVFEGPNRLLDWGVRSFAGHRNNRQAMAADRVSRLLELHEPAMVVIRRKPDGGSEGGKMGHLILKAIRGETESRSVAFRSVSEKSVERSFQQDGYRTKHQIASALAERFADLHWKLPPKRKAWQSEHHNMAIFDAAALGIAFLNEVAASRASQSLR